MQLHYFHIYKLLLEHFKYKNDINGCVLGRGHNKVPKHSPRKKEYKERQFSIRGPGDI